MPVRIYKRNNFVVLDDGVGASMLFNPFLTTMEISDSMVRIVENGTRPKDKVLNLSDIRNQSNSSIGTDDDVIGYLTSLGFNIATVESVNTVAINLQAHIDSTTKFYLNNSRINNVDIRYYTLTISGGSGQCTKYLTSDGLVKGTGNTFLFSSVISGSGISPIIEPINEAAGVFGFSYNTSTGLATWVFLESKNTGVLIGGNIEGLEAQENTASATCWVTGIRT